MWSKDVAEMLGLEAVDGGILGGNVIIEGMDPHTEVRGTPVR